MTNKNDIDAISNKVLARALKELSAKYIDRCVSEDFKKSGSEIYSLGVQDGIDVIMKMVTSIFEDISTNDQIENISKLEESLKGLLS